MRGKDFSTNKNGQEHLTLYKIFLWWSGAFNKYKNKFNLRTRENM
jgi:hypothetical protein